MKAEASKTSKRKIIKEGKFIRFAKIGEWEYFERNNCSGIVIILAMTNDGEVLFVEQYRPPVGKSVVEFPAGLVGDETKKKKETLAAAAKRELLEETGYRAKKISIILKGPVSAGSSSDIVTIVRASDLTFVHNGGGVDLETIKVHKINIHQADRWLKGMEKRGFLIEPKIYTGLYFLKNTSKSY